MTFFQQFSNLFKGVFFIVVQYEYILAILTQFGYCFTNKCIHFVNRQFLFNILIAFKVLINNTYYGNIPILF